MPLLILFLHNIISCLFLEFDLGEIHLEMFLQMFSEASLHAKIMWLKSDFFCVFEHIMTQINDLNEKIDWEVTVETYLV